MTSPQTWDGHQRPGIRINTFPPPIRRGRLCPALLLLSPKWCQRSPCWILGYWEWWKRHGLRAYAEQKGFTTAPSTCNKTPVAEKRPFFEVRACSPQASDFVTLKATQITTSAACFLFQVEILRSRGIHCQSWISALPLEKSLAAGKRRCFAVQGWEL